MINWLHKTTRRGGYAAWRHARRAPRSFRHGLVFTVLVVAVVVALYLVLALLRAGLVALVHLPLSLAAAIQMRMATPSARPGLIAAAVLILAGLVAGYLARRALSRYQTR